MIFDLFLITSPILISQIIGIIYRADVNTNKKAKKAFLVCTGFVVFLFIALRNVDMGSKDTAGYALSWEKYAKLSLETIISRLHRGIIKSETGYVLTIGLLTKIFPASRWLFVFTGLFFSISICRFLYLNSEKSFLYSPR